MPEMWTLPANLKWGRPDFHGCYNVRDN